jgi:protein-disulfide isomerase
VTTVSTPRALSKSTLILWGLVIVMAAALAAILVRQPGLLTASSAGDLKQTEMESVVRNYLMKNPEIIADAIDELRSRQARADEEDARQQIAKRQDDIFHDAASVATIDGGAVNVAEFFDYNCGYCRQSHENTKKLQAKDGVRFVFKEFPILGPGSVAAAKAAIASISQGRDKYIAYHDALMTYPGHVDGDVAMEVAAKVGLDVEKLKADMAAPQVQDTIDRNMALARAIGVSGTPSFVIGNELVPGAAEYSHLESVVDDQTDS